jgi:hypothetical protein
MSQEKLLGRRVCLDLDTRCTHRANSVLPGVVVAVSQLRRADGLQVWRGKHPSVELRVRLDDGREYEATDCDIFGFVTEDGRIACRTFDGKRREG